MYLSTNEVRSSRPVKTSNSPVGIDKPSSKEKSTQDSESQHASDSYTSSMSSPKGNTRKEQKNLSDGRSNNSKGRRTTRPRSEGENYL